MASWTNDSFPVVVPALNQETGCVASPLVWLGEMLSLAADWFAKGDRSSGENDGKSCESWRGSEDTNSPNVDDGDSEGSVFGTLLASLRAGVAPTMTGNSGFAEDVGTLGGGSNRDENGESGGAFEGRESGVVGRLEGFCGDSGRGINGCRERFGGCAI